MAWTSLRTLECFFRISTSARRTLNQTSGELSLESRHSDIFATTAAAQHTPRLLVQSERTLRFESLTHTKHTEQSQTKLADLEFATVFLAFSAASKAHYRRDNAAIVRKRASREFMSKGIRSKCSPLFNGRIVVVASTIAHRTHCRRSSLGSWRKRVVWVHCSAPE